MEVQCKQHVRINTIEFGRYPLKPHLINIHIPKTAGTALRDTLGNLYNRGTDQPSIVFGPYIGGYQELRSGFIDRLPDLYAREQRMLSGHYRYRDIADCLAVEPQRASLITFLRDPVRRTLSDYFYSISDVHSDVEGFKSRYPSFEHYMDCPGQMNKQYDYLRPSENASVAETLQNTIEKFDFVGITENFDADLQIILGALGGAGSAPMRVNENRNKDSMEMAFQQYGKALRERLAEDYFIYDGILSHRGLSHLGKH